MRRLRFRSGFRNQNSYEGSKRVPLISSGPACSAGELRAGAVTVVLPNINVPVIDVPEFEEFDVSIG